MRTTPRTLYLHASILWGAIADTDPRSARYESAEKHISRCSAGSVPARQHRWITQLHVYEQFWSENGRTARENTRDRSSLPAEERRLGEWARYQRRKRADLCIYQTIRLDVSPAFEWDPQTAAWNSNYSACRRHLVATGALPILDATDPDQFALARWLGRQLDLRRRHLLPPPRAAHVDSLMDLSRVG